MARPGVPNILLDKKDINYKLSSTNKEVIKMYIKYVSPYKKRLIFALLSVICVALMNIAGPYLSKVAIDVYIPAKDNNGLFNVFLMYTGVYLVLWLGSYWSSYLSIWIGQKVVTDIRKDLFVHIISLPINFFATEKKGQIMSRLTNDVNTLSEFIKSGIVSMLSDSLTIIGIVIMMFLLNVKLASVVIIIVPFIFFGTDLIAKEMRKAYTVVREKTAALNAGIEENLSGIRTVQALSKEKDNIEAFNKLNKENLAANRRAITISAIFFPFMTLSGTLSTIIVMLVGASLVIKGETTIGVVAAFIGYTSRFFLPLRNLSQVYNVYQSAAASSERIHEYFNIESTIVFPEDKLVSVDDSNQQIDFEEVTFGYTSEQNIIKGVNITIPSGKTTAIVGETGSGKTTMVKLISRMYDSNSGVIKIGGVDIKQLTKKQLRELVMVVPQDTFLFTGTVSDNIRFGNPKASDNQVIRAARLACAHDFISNLSKGYDTEVGEGGVRLSGGQKQLVSLARAILSDRSIIILDEATASVDAETESLIQEAFENLLTDKTAIIIAHRFTTLKNAEKTIVLNGGKVVGYDTHKNLVENCEYYKSLYDKQWSK